MRSNEGFAARSQEGAQEGELAATLGLVYKNVADHRAVMQALSTSSSVSGVEFSVQAPLYKGSPQIVDALKGAQSLADKIDLYFKLAFVDEVERVRYARLFQQQYTRKHPRSERQDVFLASGDVFAFSCDLVPPMQLDVPREAFDAIAQGPHESGLLARLRGGDAPDRWHLKVQVRLFLDHVFNPRRHDLPDVVAAAQELGVSPGTLAEGGEMPVVVEVSSSPSMPGYARYVLEPLVRAAGGRVVWLPT